MPGARVSAVGISLGLLLGMTPAIADPGPGQVAAKPPQKQRIVRNGTLPPGLNPMGRTRLVDGPMRTNAGQRAKVSVTLRSRKGGALPAKDVRVVKGGKGTVWVTSSGRRPFQVTVRIDAPATGDFRALHRLKRYTVRKPRVFGLSADREQQKIFADTLKKIMEGIFPEPVAEIWGWLSGALIGADEKPDPLKPINDKLDEINRKLDVVSAQIDRLEKEVRAVNCDIQTGQTAVHVANIQSAAQQLNNLVRKRNMKGRDLSNWADDVLRASSIQSDLTSLNLILMGMGGSGGALKACAEAQYDKWDVPLDEAGYYDRLWVYTRYFQTAQLLGLNTLVEAQHLRAVQSAKEAKRKLPAPKDIGQVCSSKSGVPRYGEAVDYWCDQAKVLARTVYYNTVEQTLRTGAAFGWDPRSWDQSAGRFNTPKVAIQKGTSLLWVLDLARMDTPERYCGPGPYNSADKKCTEILDYFDLPIASRRDAGWWWNAATTAQWAQLLDTPKNGGRLSSLMEAAGFPKGRSDKMIIYTHQQARSEAGNPFLQWLGGAQRSVYQPLKPVSRAFCFFDTNLVADKGGKRWPICAEPNGQTFAYLMNDYRDSYTDKSLRVGEYRYYPTKTVLQDGSDPSFYAGHLQGEQFPENEELIWYPAKVGYRAGYMVQGDGFGPPRDLQYVWPVVDVKDNRDYTCTTLKFDDRHEYRLQPTNAAGAYSMCGDDFVRWFRGWFPDPPK